MDASLYQKLVNIELNNLLLTIEELDKEVILDADLLDGVLSINMPNDKQYIINKHNVTQKIWVSSPFSSASYFSYRNNKWLNDKDISLDAMIIKELSLFISQNV